MCSGSIQVLRQGGLAQEKSMEMDATQTIDYRQEEVHRRDYVCEAQGLCLHGGGGFSVQEPGDGPLG